METLKEEPEPVIHHQQRRITAAFQQQATVSRTRLLYEEMQKRKRDLREDSWDEEKLKLPDIRLQVNKVETVGPKVGMLATLRAKNRWMKQRGNLRKVAEQKVIDKLRQDRKRTFLTQLSGPAESEKRHTWPLTNTPATHYNWSTVPSESKLEERFRCLVRTMMKLKAWHDSVRNKNAKAFDKSTDHKKGKQTKQISPRERLKSKTKLVFSLMSESQKYVATQKQKIQFNLADYQRDATRAGGLSSKVKAILRTETNKRTRKQVLAVQESIVRLKCFDRIIGVNKMRDKRLKMELARSVLLDDFDKGRIVIKQGHKGVSFYYIVSGGLGVYVTSEDKHTGDQVTRMVQVLGPGMTFGEVALMHQVRRTATVITHEKCELLRIDRPDFDAIMSAAKKFEWTSRYKFLASIPIFSDWSREDLRACNNGCRIVDYPENTIILGNTRAQQDVIHFIYSGQCVLAREIFTKTTQNQEFAPRKRVELATRADLAVHDESGRRLQHLHHIQRRLLTECKLESSQYFGAGENLTNTYVIAVGPVECLQVPTREFVVRPSLGHVLGDMANSMNKTFPSNQELFDRYTLYKRWRKYCEEIVKGIVKMQKGTNSTTYHDVPQYFREMNHHQ